MTDRDKSMIRRRREKLKAERQWLLKTVPYNNEIMEQRLAEIDKTLRTLFSWLAPLKQVETKPVMSREEFYRRLDETLQIKRVKNENLELVKDPGTGAIVIPDKKTLDLIFEQILTSNQDFAAPPDVIEHFRQKVKNRRAHETSR